MSEMMRKNLCSNPSAKMLEETSILEEIKDDVNWMRFGCCGMRHKLQKCSMKESRHLTPKECEHPRPR